MIPAHYIAYGLIGFGMVFQVLGTIALHRFPDVYTRMHGATKCTTFGTLFVALGVAVYGFLQADAAMFLHPLIAVMFIFLTNPTSAHAIARAAYRSGVKPHGAIVDSLAEGKK